MALTRLTPLAPRGGCALWLLPLDAPVPPGEAATLANDERERASRFVFPIDRHRFIAARSALRAVLGQLAGQDPSRVRFNYGAAGKPELAGDIALAFNLSHSGAVGLLAIADDGHDAVGVDIERVREMHDPAQTLQLAQSTFDAHECAELAATDPRHLSAAFLAGWTRREACLKASGTGFSGAQPPPRTGFAMGQCTVAWPGHGQAQQAFATLETFALPEVNAIASLARLRPVAAPLAAERRQRDAAQEAA